MIIKEIRRDRRAVRHRAGVQQQLQQGMQQALAMQRRPGAANALAQFANNPWAYNRRKWGHRFRHRGLFQNGKNFTARIVINGKRRSVGIFQTVREAALAYNQAARMHYGEFAV